LSDDFWSDPLATKDEDPRVVFNFTSWYRPIVTERDREHAELLLYGIAISRC